MAAIILCGGVSSCDHGGSAHSAPKVSIDSLVATLSSRFLSHQVDEIGTARDARFSPDGSLVLIFDKFPPHVRLFRSNGEPLWRGGYSGDGPFEIKPAAVAFSGHHAWAVQRGRLTVWELDSDSLRGSSLLSLPLNFSSRAIEYGCNQELFVYGLATENIFEKRKNVDFLHRLSYSGTTNPAHAPLAYEPIWQDTTGPVSLVSYGWKGSVLSASENSIVLMHTREMQTARQIIEFDCNGTAIRTHDEMSLIGTQLQGGYQLLPAAGVTAVTDGFLIAILRPALAKEPIKTEIFRFRNGTVAESVKLRNPWFLLDYHPLQGILLATERPEPHFIVLPKSLLGL